MTHQVQISQSKQAKHLYGIFVQPFISHLLVTPQMFHYQKSMFPFGSYLTLLVIVSTKLITEYIDAALSRAQYEIIDDEEPYYEEIPELEGVWATGKTLEECRHNLAEVIDGWLVLSLKRGLPIPPIGEHRVEELKRLEVSG